MNMTDKDRFDACMDQAKFIYQKVYNRQAYQWKVTLGLWTFIAVAVNFLWEKNVRIPMWSELAVLIFYGFFWLRAVATRNLDDQEAAYHLGDFAELILTGSASALQSRPARTTFRSVRWWFGFLWNPMHLFEFLTTAAFILTAHLLLNSK
jgi:hypothetical protein